MQAHREEVILSEDGVVTLHGLPFRRGDPVEVIVLLTHSSLPAKALRPLEGTPFTLIAPFDPAVPEDDWEANR